MTRYALILPLLLAACADMPFGGAAKPASATAPDEVRPAERPATIVAPKPPASARTADQFDTTTAADRAAAAAAPAEPAGEKSLGTTVASLGDPARPGFWLETPLVSAPGKGRVVYPGSGKSSQVDLIPIDGPATAGSRISLAAMRLIEAPLTDLPVIEVYSGG
ncbi:hypothetical protein [Salipiger sp.]|uniref:hypothetical protein n=1 Tax=Salipiger sp. TaxID=2078585 RepID=UPI003A983A1D